MDGRKKKATKSVTGSKIASCIRLSILLLRCTRGVVYAGHALKQTGIDFSMFGILSIAIVTSHDTNAISLSAGVNTVYV
jgi:hypothetical protein